MSDPLSSISPGTKQQTDAVTRKIFINGTVLSNEILLSQITVSKSFNKIASAKMTFLDGSVSGRNFPLSNDDRFKPGCTIKIQLGYRGEVDTIFEGIIIKHAIKVRYQASSLLMIEAKDKAVKLTMARKNVYHINKTDKDVLTDLAADLAGDIDATSYTHKQLVQFDTTDWDFIVTRAEANGMLVLTDDGKLNAIKPSVSSPPAITATYGDNIWDFEAEMDARKQVKQTTSHSWDFTKQEVAQSDPGTATFSENGNISSDDLGAVLNAEIKLNHTGNLTDSQLQDWSDAYAMRNCLLKIAGRVRILGNAAVKPGNVIKLKGVGDRFNGNVFVTGVLHHYEGSWQTDIQFGWRDDWFFKKEDVMNKPAAGLLPGINGLQIGVVADLDDNEDGGQYRIKVQVPVITSGDEGIWARVATLDAGDSRGVYFRPQVGDEVVLGFLNDDPREAIILGYLHSKDKKKSPLPEDEGKDQYGFVTKEKMKLIFDDSNKRITIVATTPSGEKSIVMNDDASAFVMTDENQNTIKMDASGITIQSSKNVIIKGTQVMIN